MDKYALHIQDLLTVSDFAEALVGLLSIRVAAPRALLDAHPREVVGYCGRKSTVNKDFPRLRDSIS